MTHSLIYSKRLLQLINEENINYKRMYLVPSMSYKSNVESGYGSGIIYATNNFNTNLDRENDTPRHDFVEVVGSIDAKTNKPEKFLGQCLCFLQFEDEIPNKDDNEKPPTIVYDYYVLLNFLVKDSLPKRRSSFIKYKWEHITKNATELESFNSINGGVFVVPDYDVMCEKESSLLSLSWNTSPEMRDRFLHVPRKFTDCSGWELELEEEIKLGIYEDYDDSLHDNDNDNDNTGEVLIVPIDLNSKANMDAVINFEKTLEADLSDKDYDEDLEEEDNSDSE
jgi:hypothetical protein